MKNKKKIVFLLVGIILVGLLIIGATYAYLTYVMDITNGSYISKTSCFTINYDITNEDGTSDITGVLFPSRKPKGGLSGGVSLSIDSNCNFNGKGSLNLNVITGSDILFQTVDAHCEDSRTLETMTGYDVEATCTAQNNGIWVTDGTALKYAIYQTGFMQPVSVGYLNSTGVINAVSDFLVTSEETEFDIYVWLDGNLSDETYVEQSFSANVSAKVEQVNGDIQTYAVYSETDSSLRFYKNTETIAVGDTYTAKVNGVDTELTATAVYTGFESKTSTSNPAWYSNRENITTVVVEDVIKPKSTYYWFYGFKNATYIDVSKLNTSSVTNMDRMFNNAGYNSSIFEIVGLENFNTSSVTSMKSMFYSAGYSTTTWNIGDLSKWDVSGVTNMSYMFYNAGYKAATFELDLSEWDVSGVTDMNSMFYSAGYSATTWSIGDLSEWDVSNVTTSMSSMFENAGYSATTWSIGDLSSWDVSGVTSMSNMFYYAGYSATTFELDLSGWDVSDVTNMRFMFSNAGYKATTFSLDLSKWDVSGVPDMSNMFSSAGYSATTWGIGDISNWDVSGVTSMSNMFAYAGYKATTFELDLSKWDVSGVPDMSYMFSSAGYSATTWSIGDISKWDTSSVTAIQSMFQYAGYKATYSLDLSTKEVTKSDGTTYTAWDVSNVTSSYNYFANGVESKITQPTWVS